MKSMQQGQNNDLQLALGPIINSRILLSIFYWLILKLNCGEPQGREAG